MRYECPADNAFLVFFQTFRFSVALLEISYYLKFDMDLFLKAGVVVKIGFGQQPEKI